MSLSAINRAERINSSKHIDKLNNTANKLDLMKDTGLCSLPLENTCSFLIPIRIILIMFSDVMLDNSCRVKKNYKSGN